MLGSKFETENQEKFFLLKIFLLFKKSLLFPLNFEKLIILFFNSFILKWFNLFKKSISKIYSSDMSLCKVLTPQLLKKSGLQKAGLVNNKKPNGCNQKPILFSLGNATSFEPTWYGMKKFAKNPKIIGITT